MTAASATTPAWLWPLRSNGGPLMVVTRKQDAVALVLRMKEGGTRPPSSSGSRDR